MARKYIWTLCLTIGIIGNGCFVSYLHTDEFVFINETDRTIEFYIWPHMIDGVHVSTEKRTIKLLPNSKSKVFTMLSSGGKEINPNLHQGILLTFLLDDYRENKIFILVNGTECFLFENSGFALASNYENEVSSRRDRRVRHTYTFTNADFETGKPCEEEE